MLFAINSKIPTIYSRQNKCQVLFRLSPKTNGLNELMKHQTGKDQVYSFDEKTLEHVTVYKMVVEEFTGKERKLR